MGIILGSLYYLFTAGLVIAGLGFATIMFAFIVGWALNLPLYGPYEAFGDVQFILIALLIHDRYVGPMSRAFNRVAHYIHKSRKAPTASDDFDEFDNQL